MTTTTIEPKLEPIEIEQCHHSCDCNTRVGAYQYGDYTIEIHFDSEPMNPRKEWDNLGKMVCFHSHYILGDKHSYDRNDFDTQAELEKLIEADEGPCFFLPLYLYDHSGISMSTNRMYPYDDPWDAGQVGIIYILKSKVQKEWNVKRISPKLREWAYRYMKSEVEIYNRYLAGTVYGFQIKDKDDEIIGSCWGYFDDTDYVLEQALDDAKCLMQDTQQ